MDAAVHDFRTGRTQTAPGVWQGTGDSFAASYARFEELIRGRARCETPLKAGKKFCLNGWFGARSIAAGKRLDRFLGLGQSRARFLAVDLDGLDFLPRIGCQLLDAIR